TFECSCSRERIEKTLRAMGEEELHSILDEQEKIDVTCEFCSEMQTFSREDVDTFLSTPH
ncbi:MAG: Hsp33 family molecular chaperone HslO, partial [Methylococcales bacterium]